MKKQITIIVLLAISMFVFDTLTKAQGTPPAKMNYQAVARDAAGVLAANQNISVRFTIHAATAAGTVEYQETQQLTTNQFGLFTAEIGGGSVTVGAWSGITFNTTDQFLQVEFDPTGAASWIDMGTSQLLSVPYSLSAKELALPLVANVSNAATLLDITNSGAGAAISGTCNSSLAGAVTGISNTTDGIGVSGIAFSGNNAKGVDGYSFNGIGGNFRSGFGTAAVLSTAGGYALTTSGGNVGIGTATPTSLLDVQSTVGGQAINCFSSVGEGMWITAGNGRAINAVSTGTGGTGLSAIADLGAGATGVLGGSHDGTGGIFYTASGTGGYFNASTTGYALVTNKGNVGIGTLTPAYPFHVESNFALSSAYIHNTTGTGLESLVDAGSFALKGTCNTTNGTGIYGYCQTGGNSWAIAGISSDGYGGYFSTNTGSAGYFNGDIGGTGTFTYTSDAKLKKDIQPIESMMNKIMQLKPSTYEYRVGEFGTMTLSPGTHFGVIAQDLQKVFPELVKQEKYPGQKDEKTGEVTGAVDYLGVNYNELIPVLIKGMQEQQAVINELKAEVKELKAKGGR